MNKENTNAANSEEPLIRVTRARAKALGVTGEMPWQEQKRVLRAKSKRAEADESRSLVAATASFQHKRRAVLKDVTNLDAALEAQIKTKDLGKANAEQVPPVQEDAKTKLAEELSKIKVDESEERTISLGLEDEEQVINSCKDSIASNVLPRLGLRSFKKKEEGKFCKNPITSEVPSIKDIDTNFKDPQACSLYAHDIYCRLRITELERRPSVDYMEELQSDISPNMRAILVDWLVEVSEEYKLVPDTLYLTVNLIDRFLSHNHIEKQKLQLLGVACMLIASKYEEICAPRAEEFCFITDSTYTRGEVLKMESDVLNILHFHLSVPTTKTFLRRFIHAAKYSYEDPCIELEFLANYLAELTLVDHKLLKFLPSLVAASAVFLSRWTLNQSDHPWNSTLEHYTGYTASELKSTVLAMEALQADNNGCPRNAIREKYRQQKFKSVSSLTSTKPVESVL